MKIFISYRRKENVQRAMNLSSLLRENFGRDAVFLDTSDIQVGNNFPGQLTAEVDSSDLIVSIISPEWLSSSDESFRRRIDDPKDWVHRELVIALEQGKPIVPVYVGGAKKLSPHQLPDALASIANFEGYDLRDDHHWNDDVIALISRLKGRDIQTEEIRWPKPTLKYQPDPVGFLKIQQMMDGLKNWTLNEFEIESGPNRGQRGNEITRCYVFKTFSEATDFMYKATQGIEAMQHHPRWENAWKSVVVKLSTWDIGQKISDRDFVLAKYLDRLFRAYQTTNQR